MLCPSPSTSTNATARVLVIAVQLLHADHAGLFLSDGGEDQIVFRRDAGGDERTRRGEHRGGRGRGVRAGADDARSLDARGAPGGFLKIGHGSEVVERRDEHDRPARSARNDADGVGRRIDHNVLQADLAHRRGHRVCALLLVPGWRNDGAEPRE